MTKETKVKDKTWTYYVSASFDYNNGKEITNQCYATQLYQIGVYIIWNNNSSSQGNMTPNQMSTLRRKLISDEKKGTISNLQRGREIVVHEVDGFFKEV